MHLFQVVVFKHALCDRLNTKLDQHRICSETTYIMIRDLNHQNDLATCFYRFFSTNIE